MPASKKIRKYMEIAIREMQKSRSEHKDKVDPMVGVILIGANGKELGRAHRGNLRVGDHAEYTLIERFLANKNLEGSTLYVTLEPCTTRQTSKTPCSERIVSARIRRVFIGMTDPNPKIQGRGITHLQNNNIEVDFFDIDLVKQIREENKDFIEQYDQIRLITDESLDEFEGPSEKEKEPIPSATIDDFSQQIIRDYLTARGKTFKIPSPKLWSFFHRNGFVTTLKPKGPYIPTIAGLLLFGENPEDFLVQSKIKAEAHDGDKKVTLDIMGPLLSLPEKIKDFFSNNMRTYTEIREFKRIEVPEYPWEALREAIVNAIVHRDYNEGTRVMIQMFPNKISIKSPGLPLKPLSLEKIRTFNAPPYSRNPRIAETFCYMKLMEERGWGFSRMRDLLLSHGLQPPEFNYDSGYFVVTFFAHERIPGAIQVAPDVLAKLTKRQKKILDYVRKRGRITSAECAKKFKISPKTASRELKKLTQFGIVEKRGKGPTTYYILYDK
ncbi:MAG: DeoR family transcriptional regulator [Thermoplasmata archaeon]|nr:MAG: DeoR family transcriptional regulator [Thermoplasmata archaeon]